jgi:hypothetical protein
LDLSQLGQVKVWIDSSGHYRRPEVFEFKVNKKPLWADDVESAVWPAGEDDQALENKVDEQSNVDPGINGAKVSQRDH